MTHQDLTSGSLVGGFERLRDLRLPASVGPGRYGFQVQSLAAQELAVAVLQVARLGQKDREAWWACHGLDRTGELVLSRSFPRTWRTAAMELSLRSASRLHEDRLVNKVHLFSDMLPFRRWASSWLAENPPGSDLQALTLESARQQHASPAGPGGEAIQAGLRLGQLSADEINDEPTAVAAGRLLIGAYLHQGQRDLLLPYFDCV